MNIKPLNNPRKFYKAVGKTIIEGYWNEDDSPFEITCPAQLRDILLHVLNTLEVDKVFINKSKNADSRSAEKKVTKEELIAATKSHIRDVQTAISWMITRLRESGEKHDHTKLDHIEEFYNNFKYIQDGNPGDFKQMNWFKEFHLTERHHITDRCPDDVNLFDVLERVADITMACLGRSGVFYPDDLSAEILLKAYNNTIELLRKNTEVIG